MMSRTHSGTLAVENHLDRHGSDCRQYRTDVDTASSHSSSRSKSRSRGRASSSTLPRDETALRTNHETRSRTESNSSHISRTSAQRNDLPRRSSHRYYENNNIDPSNDSSMPRRHRTEDYSSSAYYTLPTEQRTSGRNDYRSLDRRWNDRSEYHENSSSQRRADRSSEHHAARTVKDLENGKRNMPHKDTEYVSIQANHVGRRSTSKDRDILEDEYADRRSRSKTRYDEIYNQRNSQDRHRSSSEVRTYDTDFYTNGHKHSHESRRDSRLVDRSSGVNNGSDRSEHRDDKGEYIQERSRNRSSRSEFERPRDQRDERTYRARQEVTERQRNHNHREGYESRERSVMNNYDQHSRRRSSSAVRNETERYNTQGETVHKMSHSAHHSSSKQSLANEEMVTSHKMPDMTHPHDGSSSRSRHVNEQRRNSTTLHSQRRGRAENEEIRDEKMRQLPCSTRESSRETSHSVCAQPCRNPRGSSNDNRQSSERAYRLYESSESRRHHRENGHGTNGTTTMTGSRPHAPCSSRRRSESASDDQDGANAPSYKQDNSLSRRSSSSRSNHDTGFASSSSSPRRDDSRLTSDISPSRYIDEECFRSCVNETKQRRRSKVVSNNSLDVPESSLSKEQSLSSSGKGDSLEEPYVEIVPVIRGNRKTFDVHKKETRSGSMENDSTSVSRNLTYEKRENARSSLKSETSIKEALTVPRSMSRSSMNTKKEISESPKHLSKIETAEISGSTSALRAGNISSKTSLSGSISSILGRNNRYQQFRSNQIDDSSIPISISDKWRKLKQSIIPDRDLVSETLTEKKTATAIFYAAAAKFMNSLPGVQTTLSKSLEPSSAAIPNGSTISSISPNKTASSLTKLDDNAISDAKSDLSNKSQGNISIQAKNEKVPSAHSIISLDVPRATESQRPSIISTACTLTSHNKRSDAYAVMIEKVDSPSSETSGQETPPPLDSDMKRRSKDMDTELTSFLPAEMSKREEKFHEAARVNDTSAIRSLLKERVNVNCRNSLDRTALHWAAANGNLGVAEALIENGADLEAKDKYGMRAVLWAAWFGHVSVLKALINAGANTRVTNKQGLGILHCAAENNHVAVISFIFEVLESHDVNQRDKNERTPLHSAAEGGHVEAVNRLLEAKADLHKKDKGGMTAVHIAAKLGHLEVLKILLLHGVEVDDRDVDGKTALHLAAEAGHKETVDLLLDYTANPNSETVKEVTPLHLAAQEGHADVCRSLVKYGLNVNAQNFQGNSALHIAAGGNHKEIARILIDAKCELDLPNSRMQTPLHVAVESGHLEVVQVLLAGGASLDTREKSGKSALQLAARGNHVAVVDMLIKAERYYASAREYHDKDVGYVDPDSYLRNPQHPHAPQMKDVLWKLATKQLKPNDWKKLAYHWRFTPEHVKAIEQEYTGTTSYKEHGYRLLNIWLHGVRKDENVLKLLFESLVAIDKKQIAESVRRKVNLQAEKPCSPSLCSVS